MTMDYQLKGLRAYVCDVNEGFWGVEDISKAQGSILSPWTA